MKKFFCFLQLYFVSVTTENINVFPSEIFLIIVSLFGGAKVRTIFQLQNIFLKK